MNLTYQDELTRLKDLVNFKVFRRYGQVLYADYGYLKPECTIAELVWGWCRNPCFANPLIKDLKVWMPDYPKVLGHANRTMTQETLQTTFDYAMRDICRKDDDAPILAFSTESTNQRDCIFELCDANHEDYLTGITRATDEDGQLWHGLKVGSDWAEGVKSVHVELLTNGGDSLWEKLFSARSVQKRVKLRNNVLMFQPFKHPMPLIDLDIVVQTTIVYHPCAWNFDILQVFGIGSNDFCDWITMARFEIKLCNKAIARVNMQSKNIVITTQQ